MPAAEDEDQRQREKNEIKRQAAGFVVGGVSNDCAEHHARKQARTKPGDARNQHQRQRSEFGDTHYYAKPTGIAPAMKISRPELHARHARHLH